MQPFTIHSFIHSFIHPFIHSLSYSFVYSLIYLFIHHNLDNFYMSYYEQEKNAHEQHHMMKRQTIQILSNQLLRNNSRSVYLVQTNSSQFLYILTLTKCIPNPTWMTHYPKNNTICTVALKCMVRN